MAELVVPYPVLKMKSAVSLYVRSIHSNALGGLAIPC